MTYSFMDRCDIGIRGQSDLSIRASTKYDKDSDSKELCHRGAYFIPTVMREGRFSRLVTATR